MACNSDADDNYNNNDKVKPKTSSFSSNIKLEEDCPTYEKRKKKFEKIAG